jgi:LPXTG-site transpeptidase (sortase) family protein
MILWVKIALIALAALPFQRYAPQTQPSLPPSHHQITQSGEGADILRITIPRIGLHDLPVTEAPFTGYTWDFSHISNEAAHLSGMPLPGNAGNAAIGAHSELALRQPGPFYRLNELQFGDEIIVQRGASFYHYSVFKSWTVKPTDLKPLYGTIAESLTLLTCSDFNTIQQYYLGRLIVRAYRVS